MVGIWPAGAVQITNEVCPDIIIDSRKFQNSLKDKGYDLKFIQIDAGHNWSNWSRLIDDVLLFFYGETDR